MDKKRIETLKENYGLEAHPEGGWFSECYTATDKKEGRPLAENLDKDSYCFMSCATAPQFTYEGFRLVGQKEIRDICGEDAQRILYLAYGD